VQQHMVRTDPRICTFNDDHTVPPFWIGWSTSLSDVDSVSQPIGSFWCKYVESPVSLNSLATWPFPLMIHLVVSKPSTPTGPRAWILPVLIPTSAPRW
jgi:hypothetical protein